MKTREKISLCLCALVIILCAFGAFLAPNDPLKVNLTAKLQGPGLQYPFGTDAMGRCVLSRVLYGGRTTLVIVLFSSFLILVTGVPIGLLMGSARRKSSLFGESLLNAATALPPIAYLIVFMGAWGSGALTTMVAIAASLFLRVIKLAKSKTELEYAKAYVLCATAAGASRMRILFVHILPNILRDIILFLCLSCAEMIMMITSFSFMGLGLGDDTIDWGSMILDAQKVAYKRPDMILYPIAVMFLATFAFNILGQEREEQP